MPSVTFESLFNNVSWQILAARSTNALCDGPMLQSATCATAPWTYMRHVFSFSHLR